MKLNKKAVADVTDPMFFGIVAVIWIVGLAVMWRFNSFGGEFTKIKIIFSIVSLPLIAGLAYIMGKNG